MHRTWVEIKEQALAHNIQTLRSLVQNGAVFCAVVKANAYGHGLKEVARIARRNGVDAFAVDCIEDALILRDLFPTSLILVLGYTMAEDFHDAIREQIDITLYDLEGLREAEAVASKSALQARVHLKIETGTSRQGVSMDDLPDLLNVFRESKYLQLIGVSTHFANIEDTANTEYATLQYQRFTQALELVQTFELEPQYIHCACSAAILLYPQTYGTLVRAGIAMYGIWSSAQVQEAMHKQSVPCELQPVLSWKTRIAQVKSIPGGTPIGYGLTEIVQKRSRIAVLPVGYWDGYDRRLSSRGEVLIAGYKCKVMGRVNMNMIMVDVSSVPNVQKNQEVILIGKDARNMITADSLAQKMGTISYEVLSRINASIPRVVV
ncbi:MAG: alanine racemase [Candidatus Uhrbacteria bacterium]|nr:alanine racemase [Candidatus Uhrbacteria bacterium]